MTKGTPSLVRARVSYLNGLGKSLAGVGIFLSGLEATQKGWTTGATASFALDVTVALLTVGCPICGIIYGVGRLAIGIYGYDIADEIDEKVGKNTLRDKFERFWVLPLHLSFE